MRQMRQNRQPAAWPVNDRRALWGARVCLVGGIITYLALAGLAIRWRSDEPFVASIFIFLAAHSAAHLLLQELRGYRDEPSP